MARTTVFSLLPGRLIGVILMLVALGGRTYAKWTKIANLGTPIGCCFFEDDQNGFVGTGNSGKQVTLQILYTTNGGTTWTVAATPTGSGQVTQISIRPDGLGYASIYSTGTMSMNLWKTIDNGRNWTDASFGSHLGSGVGISAQTGLTTAAWNPPLNAANNTNGVFFMDPATVLVTPGPNSVGKLSEAWSAYGDPSTRIWYAITELSRGLWISTDGGTTWRLRASFGPPLVTGGIMSGSIIAASGRLYVQTESNGVLRGTLSDSGRTWQNVGGPPNVPDTRTIYAGGCAGEMVIAFDEDGGVWKSNDGGDGSLTVKSEIAFTHPRFQGITACKNERQRFTITNVNCYDFRISSISFITNTNGAYTLATSPLPDTIKSGAQDTFALAFDPAKKPGNYTARVRVSGYFLTGLPPVQIDSNLDVAIFVTGEQPQLDVAPLNLVLDTASICGGQSDSVFTIHNPNCDTLTITSGPGVLLPEYSIDAIALPYRLPPDSTISIRCHYKPTVAGATAQTFPKYVATMQGNSTSVQISLSGFASDGSAELQSRPNSIDFDTVAICGSGDSAQIWLKNTGCVPLLLDDLTISGNAEFSISGGTTITRPIASNDSTSAWVYFNGPVVKGRRTATVTIRTHSQSVDSTVMTKQISIVVFVRDGGRQLTTSLAKIDFGTMTQCESRDSFYSIRNIGCDSVHVDSLRLVGAGFALGTVVLPDTLGPNDSLRIPIHAAPAGLPTNFNGMITVYSNSDSVVIPVVLSFSVTGAAPRLDLRLSIDNPSGTDGATTTLRLKADPSVIARYSSIDVTLNWNLDLLQHMASRGPNTIAPMSQFVGTGPWNVRISRTPSLAADADSSIAVFDLLVFLTKDTTTSIGLSVVRVNDTIPGSGPCTVLATASGTTFDYVTEGCNQTVIGNYLRGAMPTTIVALSPNPAHESLTLDIHSTIKQTATVHVYDLLGKEVLVQTAKLAVGENRITLATTNLARSRYGIRLKTESGVVTNAFVKE